jgi:hypothetical protein
MMAGAGWSSGSGRRRGKQTELGSLVMTTILGGAVIPFSVLLEKRV